MSEDIKKETSEHKTIDGFVKSGLISYGNNQNTLNQDDNFEKQDIHVVDTDELLNATFDERKYLLEPIISHPTLTMIYSYPGVGKTFFALLLGICISHAQDIYNWKVKSPKCVFYLDGEMNAKDMKERVFKLLNGLGLTSSELNTKGKFCLYGYPDRQAPIDLGQELWREKITQDHLLGKVDVFIIDNLSSLVQLDENDNDAWKPFNAWCKFLRKQGISVIILHHSNKTSSLRGASNKIDALDNMIKLEESKGCITATFEKHRSIPANLATPFSFEIMDLNDSAIRLNFFEKRLSSTRTDFKPVVVKLFRHVKEKENLSLRELEKIFGVPKSTISTILNEDS